MTFYSTLKYRNAKTVKQHVMVSLIYKLFISVKQRQNK